MNLALGELELAEAMERAKTADLLGDPLMAYEILLETLPKFYSAKVLYRLAQGASLEQVAQEDPGLVRELHWLRWLTVQPGHRIADLPYPNLNQAKVDAMNMRKEADRLTLAHAYALAYATVEDIITFRKSRPTDETGLETLTGAMTEMAAVGHDLWVTEATVEEAVNASVLVKRLHAGVGREVREVGNAVFHVAKIVNPDHVLPDSLAAAAATLKRSVNWVDNALTQFKMETHAAERRMRPLNPTEMRRSSTSGLPTNRPYF
jgi:hypothetical protein